MLGIVTEQHFNAFQHFLQSYFNLNLSVQHNAWIPGQFCYRLKLFAFCSNGNQSCQKQVVYLCLQQWHHSAEPLSNLLSGATSLNPIQPLAFHIELTGYRGKQLCYAYKKQLKSRTKPLIQWLSHMRLSCHSQLHTHNFLTINLSTNLLIIQLI